MEWLHTSDTTLLFQQCHSVTSDTCDGPSSQFKAKLKEAKTAGSPRLSRIRWDVRHCWIKHPSRNECMPWCCSPLHSNVHGACQGVCPVFHAVCISSANQLPRCTTGSPVGNASSAVPHSSIRSAISQIVHFFLRSRLSSPA